jgi:hypothetical protein
MKRMNLTDPQDIFYSDEEKHRAADEAARQALGNFFIDDQALIENSDNFRLAVLCSEVIDLRSGVIARELENDPEFRGLVIKCFKDKDYKSVRNLCRFLYGVDLYCAHVTSQVGIVVRPL